MPVLWEDSTPGNVYITLDFTSAVHYAAKSVTHDEQKAQPNRHVGIGHVGIVFSMMVDKELVLADPDDELLEEKWAHRRPVWSRTISTDVHLYQEEACTQWALVNTGARDKSNLDPSMVTWHAWPWGGFVELRL